MIHSFLKPFYRDLKTLALDTLFPIYCLSCEAEGPKFICDNCGNKLTPLAHQFCIVCQKMSVGGLTHPKCHSPHTADGLISIFDYTDEKVSEILIKGKYSFLPQVYKELGVMTANAVKKNFPHLLSPKPLALSPIPLHKWRQRWRGFNQAEILAQSLAENLSAFCTNVPFGKLMVVSVVEPLVRCKFTRTQKNLKKQERIKNLESAFALSSSSPLLSALSSRPKGEGEGGVRGNNFLLIDDVTTTGATLHEAAKVLKRNGAGKVICLTVARD